MDDGSGAPGPAGEESEAREYAIARLKAQREFWSLLGTAVIVSAIVVVIWALGDGDGFWPAWVMLGFGIALLFGGWRAYGPRRRPITEDEIRREMER